MILTIFEMSIVAEASGGEGEKASSSSWVMSSELSSPSTSLLANATDADVENSTATRWVVVALGALSRAEPAGRLDDPSGFRRDDDDDDDDDDGGDAFLILACFRLWSSTHFSNLEKWYQSVTPDLLVIKFRISLVIGEGVIMLWLIKSARFGPKLMMRST